MRLQSIWTRSCCNILRFLTLCIGGGRWRTNVKHLCRPSMVNVTSNVSSIFMMKDYLVPF